MKQFIISAFFCVMLTASAHAQIKIGITTNIVFASNDDAKTILLERDDFVERLSPFDRSSRMKTDKNISEDIYLKFVGENILSWNNNEKSGSRGF